MIFEKYSKEKNSLPIFKKVSTPLSIRYTTDAKLTTIVRQVNG